MRKPVKHLLSAAAVLITLLPAAAFASLTRIAGPTGVLTDGRVVDKMDVAFDYDRQVYLAVWGTFSYGPTNGQFLAADGSPLGAAFVISDGSQQAGWARVVYGGGKFLVSYTKILGSTAHRRSARFITYVAGSPSAPSKGAEIEIDTWSGGAGDASGMTYSNGRYLVTWWNWDHNPPQSYVTILDAAGGFVAYKKHVSTFGDGQTDPEIACDSARGRCLIVGGQWGVFNPGFSPGTWGQFINDATGDRIGGGFTISYGSIQKEATVTYSTAGDRYLVTFSRFQHTVYGTKINGATTALMDETMLRNALQSPEGAGYGLPKITYNPSTQTSFVAMMPWIGRTAVLELDRDGWTTDASFQFVPGVSDSNYNNGTKTVAPAPDPVNGRFLVADIQAFLHMRSTVFSAAGGVTTPPPPSPPPPPPPPPGPDPSSDLKVLRERGRADFNGDGHSDLLWQNVSSGYLAAWTLKGNSLLSSDLLSHRNQDNNWRMVATGDFNGDGKPDIVWHHITQGWVGVWYMNGLTLIDSVYLSVNRVADTDWQIAGSGDFNGDGKPDIVWQHRTQRWLAVWLMDGITVTASELMTPNQIFDSQWRIVGIADINLDSKADLVWRHRDSGDIGAWLMNGLTLIDSIAFNPGQVAEKEWEIAGVIDANGDGKPDLVWHHVTQGWVGVWYMNGNDLLDSVWLGPGRVPDPAWKVMGPR